MAFEGLKARIMMIIESATHQPEDLHEVQESLHEQISSYHAQGLEVPQDLQDLEAALSRHLKG